MAEEAKPTRTMQFHYIKSKDYRVILAEGAIGSITPGGRIVLSLYNERVALPKQETYAVCGDGTLGELESVAGKAGFVREVEISASIDVDTAESLLEWLADRIQELRNLDDKN
jgi:hypothetical protein